MGPRGRGRGDHGHPERRLTAGARRGGRPLAGGSAGAGRRRSLHADGRRQEHSPRSRRAGGRGVGRLGPVEHGAGAGPRQPRGRRLRLPRADPVLHRAEDDISPTRREPRRILANLHPGGSRRLLGGRLLLRPPAARGAGGARRPRPHVLAGLPRGGVDRARRAPGRSPARADRAGLAAARRDLDRRRGEPVARRPAARGDRADRGRVVPALSASLPPARERRAGRGASAGRAPPR